MAFDVEKYFDKDGGWKGESSIGSLKRVFKYPLEIVDLQLIEMPMGAEILTVQVQNGKPYLWAKADREREPRKRLFVTSATGYPLSETFTQKYVGTYQIVELGLVFHVFTDGYELEADASLKKSESLTSP